MRIAVRGIMTDAKTIVLGEDGLIMLSDEHFIVIPDDASAPAPEFPFPLLGESVKSAR